MNIDGGIAPNGVFEIRTQSTTQVQPYLYISLYSYMILKGIKNELPNQSLVVEVRKVVSHG